MRLLTAAAPLFLALVLSASQARAQNRPSTFRQAPDGTWVTTIVSPDGASRPYVFDPGTQVVPAATVKISTIDGTQSRLRYEYSLTNGVDSLQPITQIFFGNGFLPVSVQATPPGWLAVPGPGRPAFISDSDGIPPGGIGLFAMEGRALPGVTTIEVHGNTSGVVTFTDDMSEAQRRDLEFLSTGAMVSVRALGPTIAVGVNEPELTRHALLLRVALHYGEAFRLAQHPAATDLTAVVARLQGQSISDTDAVSRFRQLANQPAGDAWQQQLSDGLERCLELMAAISLPLAADQ